MALAFAAPAGLLLLGLGILPLIAHLARSQPRRRQAFGAMLLLRRLSPRLRRQTRLYDRLLLLLRLGIVTLIALAFAGLELQFTGVLPEFGGTGRVILLLDQSRSMLAMDSGSSLYSRARSAASARLRSLPDSAQVAVIGFSDEPRPFTPGFTGDHASASASVDASQVHAGGSNLRAALREARRLLGGEPGELLVYTDEAGPEMVSESRVELERLIAGGSAVLPVVSRPAHPTNSAVLSAVYGAGVQGGAVHIGVQNYGDESVELSCEVTLPDGALIPIFIDLKPGASGGTSVTVPREALGGVGSVRCEDDGLDFDDEAYFHLPRIGASRVLVVDGDPGDTPTASEVYFLERALSPWGGARTGLRPEVILPSGLNQLDPEVHQVVFLANVVDPRPFASRLSAFVHAGGTLIISGGSNISPARYNAVLSELLPSPLRDTLALSHGDEPGVALAIPDARDPFVSGLAPAAQRGLSRVHSQRVLRLKAFAESDSVRTILRYEGGLPALVERTVGNGRVLLWTSSLDFDWTTLPVQSVFLPFMQRLVRTSGAELSGGGSRFTGVVGRPVRIPIPDGLTRLELVGPSGQVVSSRLEGSEMVFTPGQAGAFYARTEGSEPLAWIAVNPSTRESDLRRYERIERVEAELDPARFTERVALSPYLLFLALIGLIAQFIFFSGRTEP